MKGKAALKGLFLQPVHSHVRYHKRLAGVAKAGVTPQVMYFDRDYYPGPPLPVETAECLGTMRARRYAERVPKLIRAARRVRSASAEVDFVYAYGLDMLVLALLATRGLRHRPRIVYEAGDIGHYTDPGIRPRLFRRLEGLALRSTDLLVVTAPLFAEDYYIPLQGADRGRIKLLENKLDPEWFACEPTAHAPQAEVLRVGYFGVVRCRDSWETVKAIARQGGDRVLIDMRGLLLIGGVEEDLVALPNIHYGGTYVEPDDLAEMYGGVDISWTAQNSPSSKWARTNRFYKACAFRKPQIVAAGTADARAVADLGLGLEIDVRDPERAAGQVLAVTSAELARWTANAASLPASTYTYTTDHEQLVDLIASIDPGSTGVVA